MNTVNSERPPVPSVTAISTLSLEGELKFCTQTPRINAKACAAVNACLLNSGTHISALKQDFKNLVGNFFGINMRRLYKNFSLLAIKLREEFDMTDNML